MGWRRGVAERPLPVGRRQSGFYHVLRDAVIGMDILRCYHVTREYPRHEYEFCTG